MIFKELFDLIKKREKERPKGSYIASLFNSGLDRIAQKVGEEAIETIIAAKNKDKKAQIFEIADLWFHLTILMVELGVSFTDIDNELKKRRKSE